MQEKSSATTILLNLHVPGNTKGCWYLLYAIESCLEDRTLLLSSMNRLYPAVAKKYDTNVACVERAMRYAIQLAFEKCAKDVWAEYFGEHRKVKVSEFISAIVLRLL